MSMRRFSILFLSLFLLVACRSLPARPPMLETSTPTQQRASPEPVLTAIPTASPIPSASPTAMATRATPTATFTSALTMPPGVDFQVLLHPDGGLYVGDQVSLEVMAPEGLDLAEVSVSLSVDSPQGQVDLGSNSFEPYGIGNRRQATFLWAWDTSGLAAGEYRLNFAIEPDGPAWSESVVLLPVEALPASESGSRWASIRSNCCLVYYITGTAAERDISKLTHVIDSQAEDASRKLGVEIEERIPVVLLPRVLGHGGFASEEIAVSYLDRNYAGNGSDIVLHHELVHLLDARLESQYRPSLLIEGLAVYLSGGHFKPEPLMERAAGLLPPEEGCIPASQAQVNPDAPATICGLGWYLPLEDLANHFYPSQHELGYLEGGALVQFMVETYGWEAFNRFYRDIQPPPTDGKPETGESSPALAIDLALKKHLDLSLEELETAFLEALKQEKISPHDVEDVRLTVEYYDALRRYQKALDPSAYFLYAWLPGSVEMREKEIVADYLRRPEEPENLALETLFVSADASLRVGDYPNAERTLQAVKNVLDRLEAGRSDEFEGDALAEDYYSLVQEALHLGYHPQRIQIDGDQAWIWVSGVGPDLVKIYLSRGQTGWMFMGLEAYHFLQPKMVMACS